MAIQSLGGQPFILGGLSLEGAPYTSSAAGVSTLCDAANEACIMYGHVFTEDQASHTINTTGSSSLGWLAGAVTFANAGTTVKVGLASMDLANGPAGRAANAANVISFNVSKSLTGGGGGIAANAWQEHVPDAGTMTIAHGDLVAFAVQMTAAGGADAVNVNTPATASGAVPVLTAVTSFTGGSYAAAGRVPNCVITFSDGTYGFFVGSYIFSVGATTQAWNNTSTTKEYGNFFQAPGPLSIYGLLLSATLNADCDLVLYSDPLGTPVARKTASIDANAIGVAGGSRWFPALFSSPYVTTAGQPVAGIIKPTTSTNNSAPYLTVNAAGHQKAHMLGANCYAINRNTGAFAAQNSNKDRFAVGLLVGGIDDAAAPVGRSLILQRGTPF